VDPALAAQLEDNPDAVMEVIVTASSGLDALRRQLPRGVRIQHEYRLIDSIAVVGRASALRRLARSAAVASIEPVRDVSHC
jgi:hypothetical protein